MPCRDLRAKAAKARSLNVRTGPEQADAGELIAPVPRKGLNTGTRQGWFAIRTGLSLQL